jgi:Smg protein
MLMTTSVLDILIYVFDRYMLEDTSEVPERDDLARDLELMGFGSASVERALDWLAGLADVRLQSADGPPCDRPSLRLYSDGELTRLSTESRGFLMHLERHGILSPLQREVVLDRLLALDSDELDTEQIKWVVLMVLSSQPGQEQAFARMEDLVADSTGAPPH